MTAPSRLLTIGPSHFCEKARWALDYAGIPFVEEPHLPMLHWFYVRRATGASRGHSVPILIYESEVYDDSTKIVQFASLRSKRALYDEAGEALALEEHFDSALGPPVRRLAYCYLTAQPVLFKRIFRASASTGEARILRAGGGLLAKALARAFRVSPRAATRSSDAVFSVFDEVAARLESASGDRRYLVNNTFSAADLTFVALTRPLFAPGVRGPLDVDPGLPGLREFPKDYRDTVARLAAHPAGRYAARVYADCRSRTSSPVDSESR